MIFFSTLSMQKQTRNTLKHKLYCLGKIRIFNFPFVECDPTKSEFEPVHIVKHDVM